MKNNLTQEQAKAIGILLLVLFAVIAGGFLLKNGGKFLTETLEALGLKKSADEKKADEQISADATKEAKKGISSPWNPLYMKANAPKYLDNVTIKKFCSDIAKMIYDSIGNIYDSPTQTLAAIKKCNSKAGVSAVATMFMEKYNLDLYDYLSNRLDTTEQKKVLTQILDYVNNLPA